ncbi:MAG: Smr/MutS family protein [Pseudomonadota bacterium]
MDPKPAWVEPPGSELKSIAPFRIGSRSKSQSSVALPATVSSNSPARHVMDKKTYGRMVKGKLRPEARIDLHGMTTGSALPALSGFIMRSHAAGLRLVLVITGKGKRVESHGPIPSRPGVLRHQVPEWLTRQPLAAVILEVRAAHRSHGGEGAYYVYLKRNRP